MAKRAVLYIDLLGVQKMWQHGGASAVKHRIAEFNDWVVGQINYLASDLHREGEYTVVLAGDSVSVLCQDFDQAIGIGSHLFAQAFYATEKLSSPLWLRGAIGRWSNQYLTVNTVPVRAKNFQVGTRYENEDEFLAVLALEKSGFRGMRLIIDRNFLNECSDEHTRTWAGFTRPLFTVTRLRECTYPVGDEFADVLWMTASREHYERLKGIMAKRFKRSTADSDEFVQAAWTRAVFDQVESLVWMCSHHVAHTQWPATLLDDAGPPVADQAASGSVVASTVASSTLAEGGVEAPHSEDLGPPAGAVGE